MEKITFKVICRAIPPMLSTKILMYAVKYMSAIKPAKNIKNASIIKNILVIPFFHGSFMNHLKGVKYQYQRRVYNKIINKRGSI